MPTNHDWTGMSPDGGPLYDLDHVLMSVTDILNTPKGSRLFRPKYGSNLFELVDRPASPATLLDIYAETIGAIELNEPRVKARRAAVSQLEPGRVLIDLVISYKGAEVQLPGVVVVGRAAA